MRKRKARIGRLFILPLVLGCVLFYVLPICLVVYRSMMWGLGSNETFIGLSNYRLAFQNPLFQRAVKNTARFLLVSIPLMLVVSYAAALFVSRCAGRWGFLKSVLLLPYIIPVVAVTLIVDLFFGGSGLANQALAASGLSAVDWLNSPASFWVIVILALWKNTGYNVIILASGLVTIPEEHYAAADLDGASALKKLWYITIPQMWTSTLYAILFSIINISSASRRSSSSGACTLMRISICFST